MGKRTRSRFDSFFSTLRFCIRLSWITSWGYTCARVCLYLFSALMPVVSVFASKGLIDILTAPREENLSHAIFCLAVVVVTMILTSAISNIQNYIEGLHSKLISQFINCDIINKMATIDMQFFDSPDYLDSVNAVYRDSSALGQLVWSLFTGFSAVISTGTALVLLAKENWLFSFILAMATFPTAIIDVAMARSLYEWNIKNDETHRRLSMLSSIATSRNYAGNIRLYNAKDFIVNKYKRIWKHFFQGDKRIYTRRFVLTLVASVVPYITMFMFLLVLTRSIMLGENTVGDYTLYSGLALTLNTSLSMAVSSVSSLYENGLRTDTITKFQRQKNTVENKGTYVLRKQQIDVEFVNVTFHYPNTTANVLEGLSFKVEAEKKICLIGINGAGKSTIIKLLLRFYDVSSGEILLDGRDIRSYTIESVRNYFSTCFQEYLNFPLTIAENIMISDLEKTNVEDNKRDAMHAIHRAGAERVIQKAPAGLDTYLTRAFNESGIELSGGENQKISLARALYRSRPFLIYDEPSAALDPKAEADLFERLKEIWAGKTVIFTSHRLALVHLADKILLLENGRIAESGTHKELMSQESKYKELYLLQAQKYSE